MTKKMKALNLFVPITRINDEKRIVTGVAFANEVVEGEGGIRLKRTAMEAATPDYMKWGTVRAMHQPAAAGTAAPLDPEIAALCGARWIDDEKLGRVCELSSYISDDSDWKKVKDGTYKGYSVGVQPRMMRGKNVEACTWIETSLVDRPKDPDALLTQYRAEEMSEEVDVEVQRASFAEYLEGWAPSSLRDMALDYLWNSLWDIQYSAGDDATPEQKEAAIRQTCAEFADFMVGALATGDIPNLNTADDEEVDRVDLPTIERVMASQKLLPVSTELWTKLHEDLGTANEQISTLTRGQEDIQTELARVQGLEQDAVKRAQAAEARVKDLESQPTRRPPVRVPSAVERTFASEKAPVDTEKIAELRREYDALVASPRTPDTKTTDQRVTRMQVIKRELAELERG